MRRSIPGAVRLKYLNRAGTWPSGNPRLYYRPPGQKGIPLPDLPKEHPDFLTAYAKHAKGQPVKSPHGSIGAAIGAYLASEHYLTRAASTRAVWRRYLDDTRNRYGKGQMADLRPRHIRLALAEFSAHEANNRLKAWRALCRWAIDVGLIDTDPARDVRKRETPLTDGHAPWTRNDVERFRAHWPIGSAQRLAFEVMHHMGCAIVDALKVGDANVQDGWIVYTRQKSGTVAMSPMRGGPDWFEPSDMLQRCLDARPARHMLWITTAQGRARSPKSASQWFSAACRAAGIEGKAAHGIRKYRASVFRENGATPDQRMAVLGHDTSAQEAHYSKSADAKRIISGTDSSNPARTLSNLGRKTQRGQ